VLIKLPTAHGPVWLEVMEISAIMGELKKPQRSLVYCSIFSEGISIDLPPEDIVELIALAEATSGDDEEE